MGFQCRKEMALIDSSPMDQIREDRGPRELGPAAEILSIVDLQL